MEMSHATVKELIGRAEAHADHAPAETQKIMRELIDVLVQFINHKEWDQAIEGLSQTEIEQLEKDIAQIRKELYEGEG
jgi:cob(I)alamin adenosyltransferase